MIDLIYLLIDWFIYWLKNIIKENVYVIDIKNIKIKKIKVFIKVIFIDKKKYFMLLIFRILKLRKLKMS